MNIGVYKHWKGFYVQVIGVALYTETKEKLVIYVPLEPHEGPRIRARPIDMFLENVMVDNVLIPRFAYIGQEM